MCCVCMHVCVGRGARGGQKKDFELELQAVVCCSVWILGTGLGSCEKAGRESP